jgi:hypothetical protein
MTAPAASMASEMGPFIAALLPTPLAKPPLVPMAPGTPATRVTAPVAVATRRTRLLM